MTKCLANTASRIFGFLEIESLGNYIMQATQDLSVILHPSLFHHNTLIIIKRKVKQNRNKASNATAKFCQTKSLKLTLETGSKCCDRVIVSFNLLVPWSNLIYQQLDSMA